ncbi:DUF192 domain-containing protein [Leptolyngbya sp. 15MV]|nr:DUF192 domain-containing protein [Leptolyngbya sp. 15MV]
MMLRPIALILAAACLACSPQGAAETAPAASAAATSARHPVSGLAVIPLTVASAGKRHAFTVEVADTPQAQARGLMFRTELGPNEGMVFPYAAPQVQGFWMKNTPLPLDIIFIGEDRRIVNIAAMTTPYSLDSVYSDGPAIAVLEIPGGRAAELGIGPGDSVEW